MCIYYIIYYIDYYRARDMVVEQGGHFWGVQGRSPWWGLEGEGPEKFLGL